MDSYIYKPINVAHPGETVLDYLDSFGWSQKDLALRSGITPKTISEICNGKAAISAATAVALERVFGRPAHFWMNLQSNFEESRIRMSENEKSDQWQKWANNFPLKEMRKRGWISNSGNGLADLNKMLSFLGVSSPMSWEATWKSEAIAYRQTRKFKTSDFAISAWVRAVEIEADELELNLFNEKNLLKSIETIRGLTRLRIDEALEQIKELLALCGVALVVMPALPKTGISGCTKWINNRKVIVAISLRYKVDDQIWFTLFHELGHVILHRKIEKFILDNAEESLTDSLVDPDMQKIEDEANRFAADTLIPPDLLTKFISFGIFDNESILGFSEAINIAPGILVGRLQKEGILQQYQGNQLKQKVNWELSSEGDK